MYALGIDLGATNLKIGIVDDKGTVLRARSFPLASLSVRRPKVFFKILSKIVRDDFLPYCSGKISCIGIGLPGLIDYRKGIVHYLVNIRGWREVPVERYLRGALQLPVFVDNDVNMMAFGEYRFGAGKGSAHLFCMTLGTGVGGAFVIKGDLYRGASFSAGEIGHIPLNERGPKCLCGGSGCLERYIGNKELARMAEQIYRGARPERLREILAAQKTKTITPKMLCMLAATGDRKAQSLWNTAASHLATALTTLVNLCNPDTIVIGGGVAGAGMFLFKPLRTALRARAMRLPARTVKIKKAALGEDAGIIGAAAYAIARLTEKKP